MKKRSFFGIAPPKLTYEILEDAQPETVSVAPGEKITLFIDVPFEKASTALLKLGDEVMGGEKLRMYPDSEAYAVSPVAGKIDAIMPFLGIMGKQMTSVTIRVAGDGRTDDAFGKAMQTPSLETAGAFLAALPGKPDFDQLMDAGRPVKTIVVIGADQDLLTVTNQSIVKNEIASVKTGMDTLRKITGIQNVILVVPSHLVQAAGAAGVGVKSIGNAYPSAHPALVVLNLLTDLGSSRSSGIAFFSAEAAAQIGVAFKTGQLPLKKHLTFVKKDGSRQLVSAPIGTHVKDILETLGESVKTGDRIIFGGPMTGNAIYSLDHPVQPDTDTIIIQDQEEIVLSADTPCINCGQCVRVCPTNVPVNELIRYLDAGEYEQAEQQAELDACIECGYCTSVCEARIPIFQFIRLAKHALERMKAAEEENA